MHPRSAPPSSALGRSALGASVIAVAARLARWPGWSGWLTGCRLLGRLRPHTADRDAVDRARRVDAVLVPDADQIVSRPGCLDVLCAGTDRPVVGRIVDLAGEDRRELLTEMGVRREDRPGSQPDEAAIRTGRRRAALEVDEREPWNHLLDPRCRPLDQAEQLAR